MKIYTKTGDSGTSGLYSGERESKADPIFAAVGDIDELSAAIGVCLSDWDSLESYPSTPEIANPTIASFHPTVISTFRSIQERLLDIGSSVATISGESRIAKTRFAGRGESCVADLEAQIDAMDAVLPVLKNFILPGGTTHVVTKTDGYTTRQHGVPFPSHVHLARSIARRAERNVVAVETSEPAVRKYLNRLSDYLFVVARLYALSSTATEVRYSPIKGTIVSSPLIDTVGTTYDSTQSYR